MQHSIHKLIHTLTATNTLGTYLLTKTLIPLLSKQVVVLFYFPKPTYLNR